MPRAEEPLHAKKPLHAEKLLNTEKPLDTEDAMHANDEGPLHANDVEERAAGCEDASFRIPQPHAWRRQDLDSGRHNRG